MACGGGGLNWWAKDSIDWKEGGEDWVGGMEKSGRGWRLKKGGGENRGEDGEKGRGGEGGGGGRRGDSASTTFE